MKNHSRSRIKADCLCVRQNGHPCLQNNTFDKTQLTQPRQLDMVKAVSARQMLNKPPYLESAMVTEITWSQMHNLYRNYAKIT